MKGSIVHFIFLFSTFGALADMPSRLRGTQRSDEKQHAVVCRLLNIATMTESEDGGLNEDVAVACIPIVDDQERDDVIFIKLPDYFEEANREQLARGHLYVEISNAELLNNDIAVTADSEYTVLHFANDRSRHLGTTIGTKTVAIVRISTRDSTPTVTTAQLKKQFDAGVVAFPSQYKKCSFGQLQWKLANAGVIDVKLDQPVATFGTGGTKIVEAAQDKIVQMLQIDQISSLADRVIFCVPPGTGTWVGTAGMNHWRAQFNDDWCLSLTATMHELGHTIGLVHANEGGVKYGDSTGIMSKSYRSQDAPLRCFDGRSNSVLGWYASRKLTFNPLQDKTPRLINLAAFVDYDKAKADHPVLVTLPGEIFIQYNRAKSFHAGTGEKADTVTVAQSDKSGSNLLSGLSPGNRYEFANYQGSGKKLIVEACRTVTGDASSPDTMIISLGVGSSACKA